IKVPTTYINRLQDSKKADSAKRNRSTPRYIGFLAYLYRPHTTRTLGGSTGAGVPCPTTAKIQIHRQKIATPYSAGTNARYWGSSHLSRKGIGLGGKIQYGIRAVTIPGTMIVKMTFFSSKI